MDPCCALEPASDKKEEEKVVYPSLYIDGDENLKSIPEEGEALIKFKRVSKTIRQNDDEAPKCSVTLEVQNLEVYNYDEAKPKSAEEAFNEIASEVRKKSDY
jgi:hypothetical protein